MDLSSTTHDHSVTPPRSEGNFVLGFALGALLGLLPVIILLFVGGAETRRGSLWGFGARFGVFAVGILIYLLGN
jgi:hypothetical protein